MKIKRDSLLYEMLIGGRGEYEITNVCALVKRVLAVAFFVVIAVIAAGTAVGMTFFGVGDFIGWLAAMMVTGSFFEPNMSAGLVTVFVSITAMGSVLFLLTVGVAKIATLNKRNSYLNAVYGGATGKFCTRITYED